MIKYAQAMEVCTYSSSLTPAVRKRRKAMCMGQGLYSRSFLCLRCYGIAANIFQLLIGVQDTHYHNTSLFSAVAWYFVWRDSAYIYGEQIILDGGMFSNNSRKQSSPSNHCIGRACFSTKLSLANMISLNDLFTDKRAILNDSGWRLVVRQQWNMEDSNVSSLIHIC